MQEFITNQIDIELEEENILKLKIFFNDNKQFIKHHIFYEYEDIKKLANLYEEFIDKNNLRLNDFLMLFLLELRYDQLVEKIKVDNEKKKETINRKKQHMSSILSPIKYHKSGLSPTIKKWLELCELNIEDYEINMEYKENKRLTMERQTKKELEYKKNIYNYGYQFAEKFRVVP